MSDNSRNNNVLKPNLLNKLLNKSHRGYVIRSFSVRQKDLPILALFDELVQRERARFSELVVRALEEYVRRHHPGNPQLPLTKFTTLNLKVPKLQRNHQKEKVRQMLNAVLKHVEQGYDLNPKAHEYYVQLAKHNKDLKEAKELLKRLLKGGPNSRD
jgi:hypothetical protein